MKTHRSSLISLSLLTLSLSATAHAEESAEEAALQRFSQCLAAEGAWLTDAQLSALEEQAATLANSVGEEGCEEGEDCVGAIEQASCDELAASWGSILDSTTGGFPAVEPAPFAQAYAGAVIERVRSCYVLETGAALAAEEAAAVEQFQGELAGIITQLTTMLGCNPDLEAQAPCTAALATIDCSALAGGLFDGGQSMMSGVGDACAEFFGCASARDEQMDELFDDVYLELE